MKEKWSFQLILRYHAMTLEEENLKQKLYYWVLCKIPTLNLDCMCIIKGQELVLELSSSPNYLFSQFFWNFRKATFYGQWKWRRRRFLFSLALHPQWFLSCTNSSLLLWRPFSSTLCTFLTETDSFAWTPCTEFMRNWLVAIR